MKTPLFQLLHLEFSTYYIILYHTPEISYYINYINPIISIIFTELIQIYQLKHITSLIFNHICYITYFFWAILYPLYFFENIMPIIHIKTD